MNATDIFKKLKFNDAQKSLIINAPSEYEALFSGVVFDKDYNSENVNAYDFVQVFASSQSSFIKIIPKPLLCN